MGIIIIPSNLNISSGLITQTATDGFIWNRAQKIRTAVALFIVVALIALAYFISADESIGSKGAISLLIGSALGIVFERGRFCFFCIFRDSIEDKNSTPFLGILMAIAVGSAGYAIVFGQFLPDTSTDRLPPSAHIGPVSVALIVSGLVFGIGMTLSGACLSGHLYRIGQGSLRAIPALFGSLVGFGIGFKIWNSIYLGVIIESPTLWLPHFLGYGGAFLATLAVLGVLAFLLLKSGKNSTPLSESESHPISSGQLFRSFFITRWSPLITGAIVGVIGTFAYLRIEPLGVTRQLSTLSRTILDGRELLPEKIEGLDTLAGCIAVVSTVITNNGWLILGFVFASLAVALIGNRFAFQEITVRNGSTAFLGGVLLGLSSMIALGCTVGVLLTGTQSFAVSGWVFFLSVYLGTVVSIKFKLHKS